MRLGARLAAIAACLAADRLTKLWALAWLRPRGTVPLLPVFSLTYVENTGAAFGIGFSRNGFFIALSAALSALLIWLQRSWRGKNGWVQAGLLLVLGGALGNLYDRLRYGFVVDFLDAHALGYAWPVFNVADSCVCVGAACLAWGLRLDDLGR